MEKFNEEEVAKEAIASSPDISESAFESASEENQEPLNITKISNSAPSQEDQRNARLAQACIKGVVGISGKEPDSDQLDAAREITAEAFSSLSALNPPKAVKIGITLALLAGSFAPMFFAAFKSYSEVSDHGIN